MISSYTHLHGLIMSLKYVKFSHNCFTTGSMSKRKNVNSTKPKSASWATFWMPGAVALDQNKNLEYVRTAKRLNPRQARWALFFTRFHFTLSYHPGSKNTKADSLSRQFDGYQEPPAPEPILPQTVIVSPIRWKMEDQLQAALSQDPAPPGCPPGLCYRPSSLPGPHHHSSGSRQVF